MHQRVTQITDLLAAEYGSPRLHNKSDPIDECVFILLSEKTDEDKYRKAFSNLREIGEWDQVRKSPITIIERAIRCAGMAKRRARLIKGLLNSIVSRFGRLSLAKLASMSADDAEAELLGLPGIGRKAAACVLLYCFKMPLLPVDVHTYRLAIRLGIISRRVTYAMSHEVMRSLIPVERRFAFHVNAVAHGRTRCFAHKPECSGCPIRRFCSLVGAVRPLPIVVRPRPLAIDVFCGGGGMSHGFSEAGFQVVQAIEMDDHAATTFEHNHSSVDVLTTDIRPLSPRECLRRLGLRRGDITVLIGGPPCQGFSESNRRTRTLHNQRNHLYREFLRFLDGIKPAWFVLENVAGLRTLAEGTVLQAILDGARAAGYVADWNELNSAHYGVPQVRRRIFVIGNRFGLPIQFPEPTHGTVDGTPLVTVRHAISDLPKLKPGAAVSRRQYRGDVVVSAYQKAMRDGGNWVDGNLVTANSSLVVERYKSIRPGDNWEAIPARLLRNYVDSSRCHTGIYYRLKWNKPSKVIGNFRKNMLIHPSQNRGLSVREAARLQSFPDDYVFVGSIGFQQQQVADAVPPLLAKAVAECVRNMDKAISCR